MKNGKLSVHKDVVLNGSYAFPALADFVLFLGRMYPDVARDPGTRFLERVLQMGEKRGIEILRALAAEFCTVSWEKCNMTIDAEYSSRIVSVEKGEALLTLSFAYTIDRANSKSPWLVVESFDVALFGSESARQQIANGKSPSDRRRAPTETFRVTDPNSHSISLLDAA